jgi:lipopolysaccharide/colanic/teichoic acid biosynthesis glycosyltransferase
VLFVQERVGCKPRINRRRIAYQPCQFYVYKFRSMRVQADHGLHERFVREFVAARGEQASIGTFKISGDSRLTRVGRVLRKTSLDELPQLLNVLKGDMSLVGPRPVPPYEVALYEEAHYQRLATLPGITGMWQVRGRSRVPFEQMIRMDIEYVQKASLWLDLKILLLTIPAVISGRGAE